ISVVYQRPTLSSFLMLDRTGFLVTVLLAVSASLVACAGPEAGNISFSEGKSESASSSDKGGTTQSTDPTSPAGGAGGGVFGTTAFAAGTPQNGPAKGRADHSVINADKDPSGQDCFSCHGTGGTASTKFGFAGTVYTDDKGTARASGA